MGADIILNTPSFEKRQKKCVVTVRRDGRGVFIVSFIGFNNKLVTAALAATSNGGAMVEAMSRIQAYWKTVNTKAGYDAMPVVGTMKSVPLDQFIQFQEIIFGNSQDESKGRAG